MSIKTRLDKLEQRIQSQWVAPYAVEQRKDETLEEAMARALDGHPPPKNWKFVLFPPPMTLEEWEAEYGPLKIEGT